MIKLCENRLFKVVYIRITVHIYFFSMMASNYIKTYLSENIQVLCHHFGSERSLTSIKTLFIFMIVTDLRLDFVFLLLSF